MYYGVTVRVFKKIGLNWTTGASDPNDIDNIVQDASEIFSLGTCGKSSEAFLILSSILFGSEAQASCSSSSQLSSSVT